MTNPLSRARASRSGSRGGRRPGLSMDDDVPKTDRGVRTRHGTHIKGRTTHDLLGREPPPIQHDSREKDPQPLDPLAQKPAPIEAVNRLLLGCLDFINKTPRPVLLRRLLFVFAAMLLLIPGLNHIDISTSLHGVEGRIATPHHCKLASIDQAAANLQNRTWLDQLKVTQTRKSFGVWRRVLYWTVGGAALSPDAGDGCVDFILKPSSIFFLGRSSELIDLLLNGKVAHLMGENIVMLGWAKVALALGCCRVVIFESDADFISYVNPERRQVYIMDYKSLPMAKETLLEDEALRRRTWWFSYWGENQTSISRQGLNFSTDHVLVPFNYSASPSLHKLHSAADVVSMGVLPTSITMNHVTQTTRRRRECDAFFMGKSWAVVEPVIPLIKMIETKLQSNPPPQKEITLCTGFRISGLSSNDELDSFFGFSVRHTVNLGRMKPWEFAEVVGSARVVIGSGNPPMSPTITDTIFGGGVFMAPSRQFGRMEEHPLFIKTDRTFRGMEEQADRILQLISGDDERKQFGGYKDTSYNIEHVCRQVLRIINRS